MNVAYDSIVLGAGVNGLVAATTLARAGRKVLVLEEGELPGREALAAEFAPGFRAAPLALEAEWLAPVIARDIGLGAVERIVPATPVSVPVGRGDWLAIPADLERGAEAIGRYSAEDARRWPAFAAGLAQLSGFLEALYVLPPPDIDATALQDILPLLGLARRARGLGRRGMTELLRVMPMAVQEYLDDNLGFGPLKAAMGALGVAEIRQGPRSGGTAFVLLHHQVGAQPGAIRGRGYWAAGADALLQAVADAAQKAGVTIRCGAEAASITAADDGVTGVALSGGEHLPARTVLSSADPARTLLGLVDPVWLDPEFLLAVRNIKFRGSSSRVLYALDALPSVAGLPDLDTALRGTLTLSSSLDHIERAADAAKYGGISERPHVELQFPSLRWPGLAPEGKHVAVATVQWTPYRLADGEWTAGRREALRNTVTAVIEEAVPGFSGRVREAVVGAPPELEATFGLTEGAVTQGELTLDQILFMRPVPEASGYETPLRGLYLCGAGSHPGPGIAGGPGWLAARQALRKRS